jgi:hypothetical protein
VPPLTHLISCTPTKSKVHFDTSFGTVMSKPALYRLWTYFWWCGGVTPTPNPKAGGSPFVGCPQLLIQYIHSYPPYLEAVSLVCNLRMGRAVMTRDLFNWHITSIWSKEELSEQWKECIIVPIYNKGNKTD